MVIAAGKFYSTFQTDTLQSNWINVSEIKTLSETDIAHAGTKLKITTQHNANTYLLSNFTSA